MTKMNAQVGRLTLPDVIKDLGLIPAEYMDITISKITLGVKNEEIATT